MKITLLLSFSILILCNHVRSEIIGDNYFGRNLELQFQKTFALQYGLSFSENVNVTLPSLKKHTEAVKIDCEKGADAVLYANGSRQASISVRFCEKSIIEKKLKDIESYYKSTPKQLKGHQPFYSQSYLDGAIFENYQFPFVMISHGLMISMYTITTNPGDNLAVISSIYFYRDKSNCPAEIKIICTDDGTLMKNFNQLILSEDEKYLNPSINEVYDQFAYNMTEKQWQKMADLTELVKQSGAFELIRKKFPELEKKEIFDPMYIAGNLRTQKDGSHRAYISVGIAFGDEPYDDEIIDGAYSILNNTFDSYMTKYLLTLSDDNK